MSVRSPARHRDVNFDEPLQGVRASRTAAARNRALADHAIVVGQLLAAADVSCGADPDRLVDDEEVAVRRARVVDEPRDVAADVRVAAPRAVDAEDPELAAPAVLLLARFAVVVISDQFAGVVDDPGVFRNRPGRKHAVSMHTRTAPLDPREPL